MIPLFFSALETLVKGLLPTPQTQTCITCNQSLPLDRFPRNECLRPFWLELSTHMKPRCKEHDVQFDQNYIQKTAKVDLERIVQVKDAYEMWVKQQNKCSICQGYLLTMNYRTMHSAYSPLSRSVYDPIVVTKEEKDETKQQMVHADCAVKENHTLVWGTEEMAQKKEINDLRLDCLTLQQEVKLLADPYVLSDEETSKLTKALTEVMEANNKKQAKTRSGGRHQKLKVNEKTVAPPFVPMPKEIQTDIPTTSLTAAAFSRARSFLTGVELVSEEEVEKKEQEQKGLCSYCQQTLNTASCLDPIVSNPLACPLYKNFVLAHESCAMMRLLPRLLQMYKEEKQKLEEAKKQLQDDAKTYVKRMCDVFVEAWTSEADYLERSLAGGLAYNFVQPKTLEQAEAMAKKIKDQYGVDVEDKKVFASHRLAFFPKEKLDTSTSKKRKRKATNNQED